jgi:hypothetical protein
VNPASVEIKAGKTISKDYFKQFDYLEKNPQVVLVSGGALLIDESGKKIHEVKPIMNKKKLLQRFMIKNPLLHPSIMFRNIDGLFFRKKMVHVEDYDFYLRLLSANYIIANVNDRLIKVRVRNNSVSDKHRAHQRLLAEKAKEFFYQRIKSGSDEYDSFDSNSILSIDITTSTNKIVLESNIRSKFILNDYVATRKYAASYFKHYGYVNKFFILYLLSFMPVNLKRFTMNILPTRVLRFFNN